MHLFKERWWLGMKKKIFNVDVRPYAVLFLVLVIGVFGVANGANAQLSSDILNGAIGIFGRFAGIIISFLGNMVLLVTSALIQFASYNDFIHAKPVEIGWVLMRDVVNMFFIVLLLVSAFSTIIGYNTEFHYKKVLPKLLVMAVLINFSKTLVGLMIDFSQVIMLTFVNAFSAAAGGNFMTAFRLNEITALDPNNPSVYETGAHLTASILAIMMLGISLTVLIIMAGFLVFRIVGLWMLVITAPVAFFATALPGKLKGALSVFTDGWWSRLSALLVAGPVMAFFLWLALAVVQGGDVIILKDTAEATAASSRANFVTTIGNASNIGQFFVAVVFLLMGVEFAVKVSKDISPKFEKFAQKVSKGGGPAVHLARGAARITGKGAAIGARGLDRAFDIRSNIGKAGLAIAPGSEKFAHLAGTRSREVQARRARQTEAKKGMTAAQSLAFDRAQANSFNSIDARAGQISLADTVSSAGGLKALTAEEDAKLTHIEDPNKRKAVAKANAQRVAATEMAKAKKAAEAAGDEETVTKIDEKIKKNPGLAADWAALGGVAESTDDVKEILSGKQTAAFEDSGSALAILKSIGAIDENGDVQVESEGYQYLKKNGGQRFKLAQQHMGGGEAGAAGRKAQLAVMAAGDKATSEQIAAADAARRTIVKGKGGSLSTVNLAGATKAGLPGVVMKPTAVTRNEFVINQGKDRLSALAAQGKGAEDKEVMDVKRDMLGAGALVNEAFRYDADTGFEDKGNRKAYERAISTVVSADLNELAVLDTGTLKSNPKDYNEAREAAVATLNKTKLSYLGERYNEALETVNVAAQKKISELMQIGSDEGHRIKSVLAELVKKGSVSKDDYSEAMAYSTGRSAAIPPEVLSRLESSGISADGVGAMRFQWNVDKDPKMRAIRGSVGDRVDRAAQRASSVIEKGARSTARGARAVGREAVTSGKARRAAAAYGKFKESRKQARISALEAKAEAMPEDAQPTPPEGPAV
ncbi:hypothetical protein KJ937_02750 [Patescibacteria group bacterium]|nr:hypothetical protein [Patescibacteria group bacterium]